MERNNIKLQVKQIYYCKIIDIKPTYLILMTRSLQQGLCHISEVSDYQVKDLNDFFQINTWQYFQLISTTNKQGQAGYRFSFKRINPKLLKNHSKIIPTVSGFRNLKRQVLRWLEEA